MGEFSDTPTRHGRAIEAAAALSDDLPQMLEIARHNRPDRNPSSNTKKAQEIIASMNVQVVRETDGSESVIVRSDIKLLAAKGVLHDAIYALSRASEASAT